MKCRRNNASMQSVPLQKCSHSTPGGSARAFRCHPLPLQGGTSSGLREQAWRGLVAKGARTQSPDVRQVTINAVDRVGALGMGGPTPPSKLRATRHETAHSTSPLRFTSKCRLSKHSCRVLPSGSISRTIKRVGLPIRQTISPISIGTGCGALVMRFAFHCSPLEYRPPPRSPSHA